MFPSPILTLRSISDEEDDHSDSPNGGENGHGGDPKKQHHNKDEMQKSKYDSINATTWSPNDAPYRWVTTF